MQLIVDTLGCRRGGLPILTGVSFRLEAGQALILRGPNGSGKTTLLRTLAGLQPADGGTITAPEGSIAYAGHADGLKGPLSVRQNLRFWAEVHGTSDLTPAIEAFALDDLLDRQAQDLSAGQKRRLGLARMLVTGRSIWMFDEPTVSLDAANVTLFADMIRAHLAGGGMAIMATHIDLQIDAEVLDISQFQADDTAAETSFDEAFL